MKIKQLQSIIEEEIKNVMTGLYKEDEEEGDEETQVDTSIPGEPTDEPTEEPEGEEPTEEPEGEEGEESEFKSQLLSISDMAKQAAEALPQGENEAESWIPSHLNAANELLSHVVDYFSQQAAENPEQQAGEEPTEPTEPEGDEQELPASVEPEENLPKGKEELREKIVKEKLNTIIEKKTTLVKEALSKKYYTAMASILGKAYKTQPNLVSNIALELGNMFAEDNPRFDKERFFDAIKQGTIKHSFGDYDQELSRADKERSKQIRQARKQKSSPTSSRGSEYGVPGSGLGYPERGKYAGGIGNPMNEGIMTSFHTLMKELDSADSSTMPDSEKMRAKARILTQMADLQKKFEDETDVMADKSPVQEKSEFGNPTKIKKSEAQKIKSSFNKMKKQGGHKKAMGMINKLEKASKKSK